MSIVQESKDAADAQSGMSRDSIGRRKLCTLAALAAFGIFAVVDLINQFVTNDPIGYFMREPRQLLYVAVTALAGGLAAWGFCRLPPRVQKVVRIFVWGAIAAVVTTLACFFVYGLFSFASFFAKRYTIMWALVALFFCCLAAYFWFEFWRAFKTGGPRKPDYSTE